MKKSDLKTIKSQYQQLIVQIKQWSYEYYVLDQPSVSDDVFDQYYQKLLGFEQMYPQIKRSDSPSQKIGSEVASSSLKKVTHSQVMLSLANAFNEADLLRFDQQIKKLTNKDDISYVCELKIDGLSFAVVYENQKLALAATRGDGYVGEDITENVKAMATIPNQIVNCNVPRIEVRGEVFLNLNNFNELNNEQKAKNLPLFANPRNAAAGTLRQLDSKIVAQRKLNAYFYYLINAIPLGIETHEQALLAIKSYGFSLNPEWKLCRNLAEVQSYINHYQKVRFQLPYQIDGIVIKVNELGLYETLGATSKAPRWAIAYKFPAATTVTKLISIFASVGRTGKITYNAQLQPVSLSGSTITYATLHNGDYVIDKDLRINDYVELKKAGDIIPEVIRPILSSRPKNTIKFIKALVCPECDGSLEQVAGEVDQYCVNANCPARILKSLVHFCSRNAMDIVGLNEKILLRFWEKGWIKDLADVYQLINYRQEILQLAKFGEKSFHNLANSIIKSKRQSLERLLFALGIRHVGQKTAQVLAQRFLNLSNIINCKEQELATVADIGPTIATSIVDYFANQDNKKLINKLKTLNINFDYQNNNYKQPQIFANKTFVITGTLSHSRNYYINLLENYGASITNSVSQKTDYLLVGNNPGTKFQQAQKLKIAIINEQELAMIIKKES